MKKHAEWALEQEQLAVKARERGCHDLAAWFWHLASLGWRDAAAEAGSPLERQRFLEAREKSLRELAVSADRAADDVARPPAPTQPQGVA
jgi:hypothetical protein